MKMQVQKVGLLMICCFFAVTLQGYGQDRLTNDDIIALVSAKVGRQIIAEKVRTSESNFDLSSIALVTLKEAKVHDSIVEQMLLKSKDRLPVVNNEDIILMTRGKVSRGIIIKKIQLSQINFQINTESLIEFKNAKVHDSIVKEIMLRTK